MNEESVESLGSHEESTKSGYLVGPILRACQVLKAFRSSEESLALREIVTRTRLNKTTAFRAAQSLVAGGMLERVGGDQYRSLMLACRSSHFRLGYAAMAGNSLMSREISQSLRLAAATRHIELVELDNELSTQVAIRNSERLVRDDIDLAIEFQVHHHVAATIASNFTHAGIPVIAIHTPHPGAVFFGGNNYLAGRIGGRALGRWAINHWNSEVDSILLLAHFAAGPLTNSRLTGVEAGISELLHAGSPEVLTLDAKGGYAESLEIVMKHLARSRAQHILVGCINDTVALGALRAFAEAGRSEHCAIIGQNGTVAARAELRQAHSSLIGSVGFFPEKYGDQILSLALDMLHGKPVPSAVYTKHTLLTRQNVDHYYPNDALAPLPDMDALLFHRYH
jgi:ribose transport system substrate-binding protein